ncbi:hypothetical protein CUMW_216760 [Citrus unshiu]|uniref:Uncharacterized protein n=1 Tax=Citrus unshiu TaxID=55188 RepID=A0A2H5QCC9_CITUN|nr:hypothetical protein CUMW_216760 [Citrus unshiu]
MMIEKLFKDDVAPAKDSIMFRLHEMENGNLSLVLSYVRPRTLMGAGLYFMEDILLSSVKKKWDQLTRTIATVIDAASATPFWNKAMISRANTVSKQNSDDNISCRTMLTQISCSSIPTISPSSGKGQSVKHKCTMLLSQLYITRKTMKQTKANRKRLKPGENPRPRPKDS